MRQTNDGMDISETLMAATQIVAAYVGGARKRPNINLGADGRPVAERRDLDLARMGQAALSKAAPSQERT